MFSEGWKGNIRKKRVKSLVLTKRSYILKQPWKFQCSYYTETRQLQAWVFRRITEFCLSHFKKYLDFFSVSCQHNTKIGVCFYALMDDIQNCSRYMFFHAWTVFALNIFYLYVVTAKLKKTSLFLFQLL